MLVPVIYIIYTGIIGRIHGEKKDRNPAPNAIGIETSPKVISKPPNMFIPPIPINITGNIKNNDRE